MGTTAGFIFTFFHEQKVSLYFNPSSTAMMLPQAKPIQRIEEKCSWWELSLEEDNDECSSNFAEHSAVVSTSLPVLFLSPIHN